MENPPWGKCCATHALKQEGIQHPEKTDGLVVTYYNAVKRIIERAAKEHYSIVLEDHGDHSRWLRTTLQSVPPAYEKLFIGIAQDKKRFDMKAAKRYKSGKVVDYALTLAMYRDLSQNWEGYVELFDYSALYFRKAKQQPELAAEFSDHGRTRIIYGKKEYAEFQQHKFLDPQLEPEKAWLNAGKVTTDGDKPGRLAEGGKSRLRRMIHSASESAREK